MGGGHSGFDKNAHEEKAVRDAIRSTSDDIRDRDSESLVILDRFGRILGRVDGGRHEVGSQELDDLTEGSYVVHNHPEGGTFTPSDILKHVEGLSAELYAVSSKWNYLIRPKERKHPEGRLEFYRAYDRANREMHDKAEREFIEKAKDNPSMWADYEKTVLSRWDTLSHEWLQKNASKYGYEYSRTSVKRRAK